MKIMQQRHIKIITPIIGIGCLLLASGPVSASAASVPTPNYQFGVVEANLAVSQAQNLGIGWTRVPLSWAGLQPTPESWNNYYTNNDQSLLALATDGIVPVGVVQTVPAWASINPAQAPDGVPSGLSLPWNNPKNYWGQFMYQLARHYTGLINTWIIGNEISIRSGNAKSFDGTVEQMAEMIRIASLAVHAANPAATVQAPGAPYWYDKGNTTNALLTDLARLPGAAQNHDFIDGLNLHIYNTVQWNALIYASYRQMLKSHGLGSLPIWLSETNAVPDNPLVIGITPADQADFLIENMAASFAYVNHVEVYKLTDGSPRAKLQYGLLSAAGAPNPAYTAVKMLSSVLAGTQYLHESVLPYEWDARSTPAVVTFGGVRRLVNVVWDQGFSPTSVKLPAYAASAIVMTASGASQETRATHGQFVLHLTPATTRSPSTPTNAPIGGPPLIVVQSVELGQAGTPTTPPINSPAEFTRPAAPLTAQRGAETVQVNPDQATVKISTGSSSVTVGGWGTAPGDLLGPSGVAIGPTGTVYVTNSGAQAVVAYAPNGNVLAEWGTYSRRPGDFNGPSGIAVGPRGTVYVADTLNQRVEAFSPSGQFKGQISTAWPSSLTVPSSGHLQVTNAMTGAVSTVSF